MGVGIEGDPGGVEGAAGTLARAGRDFTDAVDSIASHGRQVTAHWAGTASDAASAAIAALSRRTRVGAEVCAAADPVLRTYAAALRAAQARHDHGAATAAAGAAALRDASRAQAVAGALPADDPTRAGAIADAASARRDAHARHDDGVLVMGEATAAAEAANAAAAAAIDAVAEQLAGMAGTRSGPSASAGPGAGSGDRSGHHEAWDGVWATGEFALVAAIDAQPPGAAGDAAVRAQLAGTTPQELADLLARHPALARRLTRSAAVPAALAPAMTDGLFMTPRGRIAAVSAAFALMPSDEARRLALLHPGLVGNLDGAPLGERVAANRVTLAVARDDEVVRRAGLQRLAGYGQGDTSALEEAAAASAKRITVYDRLLEGTAADPAGRGHGGTHHQVLFFDPSGDGKIAEMWGPIDADTRHVAILVPGTGTDLTTFDGTSRLAQRLVTSDRLHATTAVAWAAVDLPDDLWRAAHPAYAEVGGPALSAFTLGLDVPATADTTVIGHSYGAAVVGAADAGGLAADRVVLVEPGGAGPGVHSVGDYASGPDVQRFTMTAPGDPIADVQGVNGFGLGLGGDPDRMPGFTSLETGRYHDVPESPGQVVTGLAAHSGVMDPLSTSWNNIVGVVQGTRVTPLAPLVPSQDQAISPYYDPSYPGPGAVPVLPPPR